MTERKRRISARIQMAALVLVTIMVLGGCGEDLSESEAQALVGGGCLSSTPLYYEDFEDGDISDWSMGTDGTLRTVDATMGAGCQSSKSLKIDGGASVHYEGANYILAAPIAPVKVSYYARAGAITGDVGYFYLGASNALSYTRFSSGAWRVCGSGCNNYGSYAADTWYHVEHRIDWVAKTFDLYVDGALLVAGTSFNNIGLTSFEQFGYYNFTAGQSWLDQIIME